MDSKELRNKYLDFFREKGHAIIQSASLIPENDPTVLFTTAGMHPLVPFLMGEPHPLGKRLADVQKCIRTVDFENIGDDTHLTFFEMLGNWSLGDYFKKEAIEWSYEFLTKVLGFEPEKLHVTCFAGDEDAPKDDFSAEVWESLGIPKERIYFLPKEDNWWGPAGETGPCGPDTEMFIDTGREKCSPECMPGCGCGKYFEIWNDVFMEYNKKKDGTFEKLKQQNVDTGMGVERTIAMMNGKNSVYEIETFVPIVSKIKELANVQNPDKEQERAIRIIADHTRSATFVLGDDKAIVPSNLDQGYILRRFLRRSVRYGKLLGIEGNFLTEISKIVIDVFGDVWEELSRNKEFILKQIELEEDRFQKALQEGLKRAEKIFESKAPIAEDKYKKIMGNENKKETFRKLYADKKEGAPFEGVDVTTKEILDATVSGEQAFRLFQSYGFPIEMIVELAQAKNLFVDIEDFEREFKKHQELSRVGAEKRFKGGLSDASDQTTKLHTATHLLNEALRKVLGKNDIVQKGSNITPERLRFDFNFDRKLTDEELKAVEDMVNEKIEQGLDVVREEMSPEDAMAKGAQGQFGEKYGEKVSTYKIGDFSFEICGGPHVKNTSDMGHFRIKKEQSVAAGVRRIKAVLE